MPRPVNKRPTYSEAVLLGWLADYYERRGTLRGMSCGDKALYNTLRNRFGGISEAKRRARIPDAPQAERAAARVNQRLSFSRSAFWVWNRPKNNSITPVPINPTVLGSGVAENVVVSPLTSDSLNPPA